VVSFGGVEQWREGAATLLAVSRSRLAHLLLLQAAAAAAARCL